MSILDAQVGPPNADPSVKTYPTEDAKKEAWTKALILRLSRNTRALRRRHRTIYRGTERAKKDDNRCQADLKVAADSSSSDSAVRQSRAG